MMVLVCIIYHGASIKLKVNIYGNGNGSRV